MKDEEKSTHGVFILIGSMSSIALLCLLYFSHLVNMLELSAFDKLGLILFLIYLGIGFIPFVLGGLFIRKLRIVLVGVVFSIIYFSFLVLRYAIYPQLILFLDVLTFLGVSKQYFAGSLLFVLYVLFLVTCWFLVGKTLPFERVRNELKLYILYGVLYTLCFIGALGFLLFPLTHDASLFPQDLIIIAFSFGTALVVLDSLFVITWEDEDEVRSLLLGLSLYLLKEIFNGLLSRPGKSKLEYAMPLISVFIGGFLWFSLMINGLRVLLVGFGAIENVSANFVVYTSLILTMLSILFCVVAGYVNSFYRVLAWVEHSDVVEPRKPFVVKLIIRSPGNREVIIQNVTLKEKKILRILKRVNIPERLILRGIIEVFYLIEIIKRPSIGYVNLEFMINYLDGGRKNIYELKSSVQVNPLQDDVDIELVCPEIVHVGEKFPVTLKITNNRDTELEIIELAVSPTDLKISGEEKRKTVTVKNIRPKETREVKIEFIAAQRGYKRVDGFLLFIGQLGEGETVIVPESIVKVT